MARNDRKYVYYTIGVQRDSALYHALVTESEELGSRYIPLVIRLWLKEHYQAKHGNGNAPVTKGVKSNIDLSNAEGALDCWED